MTHKIGEGDINLSQVWLVSRIQNRGDDMFYLEFTNKEKITFWRTQYPDLEGERLIIIGKMNAK